MTSVASRSDRRWAWPLLWILVAPFITIPLTWLLTGLVMRTNACVTQTSVGFISESSVVCQDWALLIALAPGVLNLLPILWLRSHSRESRTAAIIASTLGSARLIVPAVGLLLAGPTEEFGTWFANFPRYPNENSNAVFAIGASLWLVGAGMLLLLALVHRRRA